MLQYTGHKELDTAQSPEQHKSCFQLLVGGTLISKVILSKQIRSEAPGPTCQENIGHPANFESQINNKSVCPKQYLTHLHVCSVVSSSLQLHGLYPPGSSVHEIFQARILARNGLAFLSPKGLPNPVIEPTTLAYPAGQVYSLPLCPLGSPLTHTDTKNVFILLS